MTQNCGVGTAAADCHGGTNNEMNIEWSTNDPCPTGQNFTFNQAPQAGNPKNCAQPVPTSPAVTDCGPSNTTCPSQTPPGPAEVPNVVGEPYSQAVSTLAAAGLGAYPTNITPTTIITSQTPAWSEDNPAFDVETPDVVQVFTATSPPPSTTTTTTTPPPQVTVPPVIGETVCGAQGVLAGAGLTLIDETANARCADKVLTEVPTAGSKVAQGSQIDVTATTGG